MRLTRLFPDAVTDGKVDFDVLRKLLGDAIDESEERYGLSWNGKRKARRLALTPSTGTLRPHPEESVAWESTRNLMIEGDNLEALKLLQREIEEETGVRFGLVEPHAFAAIGQLGVERSRRLWDHLTAHGYLNQQGQAQDALRQALDGDRLALPAEFEQLRVAVLQNRPG